MNKIRLLPEHVANQIAAGEVVERPASVVKELVENALDAGAKNIKVEIRDGGRSLIRVTDDGCGMSRDDALLALERHATSKIGSIRDLESISTFGFRGEALPSIASVSQLTLITRETDPTALEGTRVVVHGGRIVDVTAAGAPPGTTVEVRNLFYNVPARRKFLKSEATESAHIQQYLATAALAFPGVSFTLIKDGRLLWQFPAIPAAEAPSADLEVLGERLRMLLPQEPLVPVDSGVIEFAPNSPGSGTEGQEPNMTSFRLWGYVGAPGVSRASRQDQYLYVNRRPVDNRSLSAAILDAYHTLLMKGRYPVCCLFLELDPAEVDVNVHPAKREVKFRHEGPVRRLVTETIRDALKNAQTRETTTAAAPSAKASAHTQPEPKTALVQQQTLLIPGHADPTPRPTQQPLQIGFAQGAAHASTQAPPQPVTKPSTPTSQPRPLQQQHVPKPEPAPSAYAHTHTAFQQPEPTHADHEPSPEPAPLLRVPLRYLGVLGRLYVLFESDRGLVLMDQHAAHERVLFERFLQCLASGQQVPAQKLLLPQTVELSARDTDLLRRVLPHLTALGLGLSEFGERTFILDALPAFIRVEDPRRFVLDIVDAIRDAGPEPDLKRMSHETVARTVCKHAVKAHDPLSEPELLSLLDQLRQCEMPYTCPHGRPTVIELSYRELEKKFGRAV